MEPGGGAASPWAALLGMYDDVGHEAYARRLSKELKKLVQILPAWFADLQVEAGDLRTWRLTLRAPPTYTLRGQQRRSPYAGALFTYSVTFPVNYPFKRPDVRVHSAPALFHPTVDLWQPHEFIGVPFVQGRVDRTWSPTKNIWLAVEEAILPTLCDGDWWSDSTCLPPGALPPIADARSSARLIVGACAARGVVTPDGEDGWRGAGLHELQPAWHVPRPAAAVPEVPPATETLHAAALARGGEPLRLEITNPIGNRVAIAFNTAMTVREAKQVVENTSRFPTHAQIWTSSAKRLLDDLSLHDYQLRQDDVIQVQLASRGVACERCDAGYNVVAIALLQHDVNVFEVLAQHSALAPLAWRRRRAAVIAVHL
jgi:ubiquitin-protein ligase